MPPLSPNQEALLSRLEHFGTAAGRAKGLALKTLPTDVFIATSPKSGTTWTQQIVQQLRSGAPERQEVAYTEITEAVPWLEMAVDIGLDPDATQPWAPRCFKTHLWAPDCPTGGRYIVVLRSPFDCGALLSRPQAASTHVAQL